MEYPKQLSIFHPTGVVKGTIDLNRSKSISNRALIIQALCEDDIEITHLSDSDDSQTMQRLLAERPEVYDAHHAGTTYRFLTSFLAIAPGKHILTGSSRMKERPIGELVEALRRMGAQIQYIEKEGYPPLEITGGEKKLSSEVTLSAGISSQYISSLMMIGPCLEGGLVINLEGDLVSRPYLQMTVDIMRYFGAEVEWKDNSLHIGNKKYEAKPFSVEADWSAASYYYAIAALSKEARITLKGLHADSLQGDAQIARMSEGLGITTTYGDDEITIEKQSDPNPFWEYDFIEQPDLAQSLAVMCGGLGVSGLFTGLQTLRIKETDRIAALQTELGKYGIFLSKIPPHMAKKSGTEYYMIDGNATTNSDAVVQTYRDHRMAMCMAPLGLLFPIKMDDPGVVSKSYPRFWEDLKSIGFVIK